MNQFTAKLYSNSRLCASMYLAEFECNDNIENSAPGQFLTVRITTTTVPLLRRPFAFSGISSSKQRAAFIYQVRGGGTEILSRFGKETELDIIAPLGKPFPLPEPDQYSLVVAGGIGLGPILFLADTLKKNGTPHKFVFGCRSKSWLPEGLWSGDEVLCTDDGSFGFKGNVVAYLETIADELPKNTRIYCCGPEPMLKGCHLFAIHHHFSCFVSVEQVMACGVGACMGCAVKLAGGRSYARACKEGPVFESKELAWE